MEFVIVLAIIVGLLVVYAAMGIRIIRPYQQGVVERLGRYKETVGPGLNFIAPLIETMKKVDMREQVIDVPPQEVITQDNVTAAVDAVVYFEPTDPQRLLYNISNFLLAITKLSQTNLRNVIGEMTLDEAFTSRERVNNTLRQILDEATDKWGVRVVRVEIQRIDPPQDVMHAMHEQMKAERTRRAVVTEAEGTREAAITRAEGDKQSAILSAEGRKQKDILNAEGEAQAIRLNAQAEQFRQETVAAGEASAIQSVYGAIQDSGTDDRVIAIKYLETLQGIADGNATKIFLPLEMGATMGALGGIAELFQGDVPAVSERRVPAADSAAPSGSAASNIAASVAAQSGSASASRRSAAKPVTTPTPPTPPSPKLPPPPR